MHPFNMFILLSIGNVVGWLYGMYVKGALRDLIGHVFIATLGSFAAGYLSLRVTAEGNIPAMMTGAIAGAALLLFILRRGKYG